jgi:hypothetical protein
VCPALRRPVRARLWRLTSERLQVRPQLPQRCAFPDPDPEIERERMGLTGGGGQVCCGCRCCGHPRRRTQTATWAHTPSGTGSLFVSMDIYLSLYISLSLCLCRPPLTLRPDSATVCSRTRSPFLLRPSYTQASLSTARYSSEPPSLRPRRSASCPFGPAPRLSSTRSSLPRTRPLLSCGCMSHSVRVVAVCWCAPAR